jgi:hypothetical protein
MVAARPAHHISLLLPLGAARPMLGLHATRPPVPPRMSTEDSVRLPFTVPGAAGVHTAAGGAQVVLWIPEVNGLLGVERDALLLQYRVRDRAAGYDSGVREVRVPLDGIEVVEVRRRWFRPPRVVVRVRDLRLLESVPVARGVELALEINRRDLVVARDLVSTVALRAAERALGAGETRGPRHELPPT